MPESTVTEAVINLSEQEALLRLLIAAFMGSVLGFERTRKLRAAGLRTYMLVCIGSCVVTLSGILLFERYGGGFDPARMASQVISGIGFLGAGTIIVTPNHRAKGLTTAAGIWATACLGIAVGNGFYVVSAGAFAMLLVTMFFADKLELWYYSRMKRVGIGFIISSLSALKGVEAHLEEHDVFLTAVEFTDSAVRDGVYVSCVARLRKRMSHDEVVRLMLESDGVIFVERLDI